jgi:nitroreductase
MVSEVLSFEQTVRLRRSVRDFKSIALSQDEILNILDDARHAPSNCNTQPWEVHVVSGETRNALSAALLDDYENGMSSPDFSFDTDDFKGVYAERRFEQGMSYYRALGISRDDAEGRKEAFRRNLQFFNAPHAAFLFMPSVGDNVRAAADVGMYAQNFLLSLTARGYAGIPQTLLGFYADTIRKLLGVSSDYKLLFGISFGYEDTNGPSHLVRMDRAPVMDSVVLHEKLEAR